MSGRKPRRARWPAILNTMAVAQDRATIIDPAEVDDMIKLITACARALREGVATRLQWSIVAGAIDLAQAIESQGVVRGMLEQLNSAHDALKSVHDRATQGDDWTPTSLHYFEIDAMQTFIGLHSFQLRKLSLAEYKRATARAVGRIRGAGNTATMSKIIEMTGAKA
jgi:hypothetical protein